MLEWGAGIGIGSSVTSGEASATFGGGIKNNEKYTYRRDNASAFASGISITDINGVDENVRLFISPFDKRSNEYETTFSGLNSIGTDHLGLSSFLPISIDSSGLVTMRFSFYYIVGLEFTIGYNFGENEE